MTDFDGHTESYAAYEDESGDPLLVLSSVLFFDLLGVQDMARAPDAEQKLGELRVALREAIKQSEYHNHVLASRLINPEPYLVALPEVRHHFADFLDPMPSTEPGSPWYIMDRVDRSSVGELGFDLLVPDMPGVYAVYRDGLRQYVGATKNLHTRIVRYHLSQSPKMADSALRRNVAEMLGFASAAAIKDGSYVPTTTQAAEVHRWLLDCEIAWIECASRADALAEERKLKHQQLPPLTKL